MADAGLNDGAARGPRGGSLVSANVRCRDIPRPSSSLIPQRHLPHRPLASNYHPQSPAGHSTQNSTQKPTDSGSSSPLIRLSRYCHRRSSSPRHHQPHGSARLARLTSPTTNGRMITDMQLHVHIENALTPPTTRSPQ